MKSLLTLVLAVVVIGVVLKAAGVDLPVIDYPLGPFGGDLVRPEIEVQAPGFGDFQAP
jgi:hypothetical protein